jgi:glutamyl-tRNA synthetase/glutamyl-Q tRNA(Asp) synthetase
MSLTRFAPAPTGYLHLGHVLNAREVWRLAHERNARVLLRVEDHDRERCRPEYEHALLEDLDWLGFVPDLFPTAAFRAGRCESRQTDRHAHYEAAARDLIARGLIYGCICSRHAVAAAAGPLPPGEEPRYAGTCRDASIPPTPGVAWRVRIDRRAETFDDVMLGPQTQCPADECGDVAIRDRLGNWTYQFVASVDDHLQGIDLVVRGRDLLASTGRQIQIARLIGRQTPATFAHHGLVMKAPGRKLSKSDGDTGVRDLRRAGCTPADVIAAAVHA